MITALTDEICISGHYKNKQCELYTTEPPKMCNLKSVECTERVKIYNCVSQILLGQKEPAEDRNDFGCM